MLNFHNFIVFCWLQKKKKKNEKLLLLVANKNYEVISDDIFYDNIDV